MVTRESWGEQEEEEKETILCFMPFIFICEVCKITYKKVSWNQKYLKI
jgi:hypothetical protein